MLTSTDFLKEGEPFPPKDSDTRKRLQRYEQNRKIFDNEHAEVYREQFKRIERVIGNFDEIISYPVIINYQKLMSKKTADLLFGEFPKITSGEDTSVEQKCIAQMIENSDLMNTFYESAIDVSRYGDALLYVYMDEGAGKIDVSQPCMWFPIVSADNIKKVTQHVVAWQYEEANKHYLKVQIHEKGYYEERLYSMDGKSELKNYSETVNLSGQYIGKLLSSQIIKTGLDDFAVVHVPNIMTSDRVTGIDDYCDVDSIITEILVRVAQISRVLDKHAAPSVQGPSTALEKNVATGKWELKMGKYFPRDSSDEPEVSYITWDGQLESNFKMLEVLINNLYIISEMGAILLGDTDKMGNAPSGTALRLKMMSPLAKVKRIALRFTPAIKKALKLCSQYGGEGIVNLAKAPISITWQDGIPADDKEMADIITARTGNKATMSIKRALMQYDNMTSEAADEEIALIQEEDAAANPILDTMGGGLIGDDDSEDGEE